MLKRFVNILLFTFACVAAMEADPSCDEYRAVAEITTGGTVVARSNYCNWSLRAVPEPGYEFKRWTDGNTTNPRHITITPGDEDIAYTAEFVPTETIVEIVGEGYGTVTAVQSLECANQWKLTPVPNSGYSFVEWSDGNTDNPRAVALDLTDYTNQYIQAIFSADWCASKPVTVGPETPGTGTVAATRCNCDYKLTATPASGYKFAGWTDGNTDNPRYVELTDPEGTYSFYARFTSNSVCDFDTCQVSGGHGYITASKSGCDWTLEAHAHAGWEFTEWSDNNTDNPRTVTLNPSASRIAYTAVYTYVACKPFRAVLDAQNGGTISAVRSSCDWTLTATPNSGYEFAGWSDGSLDNPHTVLIANPLVTSITYSANFVPYICNYNTAKTDEGKGRISVSKTDCDPCTYTLTATPSVSGWEFSRWKDGNTDNPRTITIASVKDVPDTTFIAEFEDSYCANTRAVTTDCDGGKIVATRRHGCEWLLEAVPANSLYSFTCWSDGHTGNPRIVDFEREDASYSLSANFAPCMYSYELSGDTALVKVNVAKDPSGDGCIWTLTPAPNGGWTFDHWEDSSTDNPRSIDTDGGIALGDTIKAVFNGIWTEDFRSVITNPAGGGTVSVSHCNYTWTLTATADEANGYKFVAWEDGSIENPRSVDINPAEAEHNFNALFIIPGGGIDAWAYNGLEITTAATDILDGAGSGHASIYADGVLMAENAPVTEKDYGRWHVAFNPNVLDGHATEPLQIRVYDECDQLSCAIDTIVPVVVTGNTTIGAINPPAGADVQVVRGVLSIDKNTTLGELDIYYGTQVSLPTGKSLTVNHVYMRGDGTMGSYPSFAVNGSLTNNNSDTVYYDYTLDYSYYYPLAVPYTVPCNKIRTKTGNTPLYEVSWYNGDDRAMNETGWTVYDDTAPGAQITAGQGYSIFAVPEEWMGNRQSTVTLRFPMKADLTSGEPEKSVPVKLHNYEGVTNSSNKNWNLIGTPYLTSYVHNEDEKLLPAYFVPNPSGGGYEDSGTSLRYVTWSVDGYRSYIQNRITETTMSAFRNYFVQAAVEGNLVFSLSRRTNAPRRQWMAPEQPDETERRECELGVSLSSDKLSDRIGFLYGELFSQDYEMNADLVKMFGSNQPMSLYSIGSNGEPRAYNALAIADALQPVPLGYRNAPIATMQFAFDTAHYDTSMLDAVWLIDYETGNTTNLLDEPYTFDNTQAASDSRFALFAQLAEKQHTPTDNGFTTRDAQGKEVYDMLGRRVGISFDELPQGVYIIVEDGEPRKEVVK